MIALGAETFNGGDAFAGDVAHVGDAASDCLAFHMHGACAAEARAAAELRAGEFEKIAQVPKHGHGGIAVVFLH